MTADAALAESGSGSGSGQESGDVNMMATQARAASDMMKALAHEGRLMILCYLVEGERSVSELEELIGARQAAVSQQLARLRLEGLVSSRREGKAIYYSISDARVQSLIATLHRIFCKAD